MTSTTVFKGSLGDKPSSRVLRPPGGGSSNIFGFSEEAQEPPKVVPKVPEPVQTAAAAVDKKTESVTPSAERKDEAVNVRDVSAAGDKRDNAPSHAQPVGGAKGRNCGFNPITGEPYGVVAAAPKADEKKQSTSIAVKHPPGGASSKLW